VILLIAVALAGCTSVPEPAAPDISGYVTPIDSENPAREPGSLPAGTLTPVERGRA